jgi:hypothetical protein
MGSDWDAFRAESLWAPPRRAKVEVGSPQGVPALPGEFEERFPSFAALLHAARMTPVLINGRAHVLYGWTAPNGQSMGWLSPPPVDEIEATALHEDHQLLAATFGGIGERWNEPETSWLLNLHSALTLDLASDPIDLSVYEWSFENRNLMPLDVDEWYTIALEANGNLTICRRESGELLMCAGDHSFDHLIPLEGCPDYTFYRIRGAPTFAAWVEHVAGQWLAVVRR